MVILMSDSGHLPFSMGCIPTAMLLSEYGGPCRKPKGNPILINAIQGCEFHPHLQSNSISKTVFFERQESHQSVKSDRN